ncbi:Uric acid transporter UacT [invertebrate metagenome]|uniref:Uric acid transporter UacT n=1 Tax=invertebrate metagenome TaxID=1711999 RepID=A0A2H9T923_9ZZZZ
MKSFYAVEDKPPLGISIVLAAQHLLAAFGGIVAVPLIMGNCAGLEGSMIVQLISVTLLCSGFITIIQCTGVGPVGIRLPCVMGTSFVFVAVSISIVREYGMSGVLGSALVGSLVTILGSFCMKQMRSLLPPLVSGIVILMIGISLVPVGADWFAGGKPGSENYGDISYLITGLLVAIVVVVINRKGTGLVKAGSIVIGIILGYLGAWAAGMVDFTQVSEASWVALPAFMPFKLTFPVTGIIGMSIAYLVALMESTGNFLALSDVGKSPMTSARLSRGLLCDGLGSASFSLFGVLPVASFSQNVGIVAITGVASRFVVAITGMLLIVIGLFPKVSALIVTIPSPVLGGAGVLMFGMITSAGIRILAKHGLDERSSVIAAVSITAGVTVTVRPEILSTLPEFLKITMESGITTGGLTAVVMNQIFRERQPVEKVQEISQQG